VYKYKKTEPEQFRFLLGLLQIVTLFFSTTKQHREYT